MNVHCLIDNTVARQSSYWGEHGVSFLIEKDGERLLFDTGGSGEVLAHNLEQAGIQADQLHAVALSHSHRDHTGGLAWLLKIAPNIPVYTHPRALEPHYSNRTGDMLEKGIPFDIRLIDLPQLHRSTAPVEIMPGVHLSGEIQPRPHPEGRSPHHFIQSEAGWVPDPYFDDQSLILESSSGLILVCGCCHAGLLNTMAWVEDHFGEPPVTILGGFHLAAAGREQVQALIRALEQHGAPELRPNHCTGETPFMMLTQAFPDRVEPFPAGSSYSIS